MHTGTGQVTELVLEDGCRYARISCLPRLIPSAGQYLLASDGSDAPLPITLFHTDSDAQSFTARLPDVSAWVPGVDLYLRGPLGRGFALPLAARRVGLVAFDGSAARLRGLIRPALRQEAAIVLACDSVPASLPDEVEVQPLSALEEVLDWADYAAFDVGRENLPLLREKRPQSHRLAAQVLIRTPIPCGGLADCGICAVRLASEWKLACKDGPVFDWREI